MINKLYGIFAPKFIGNINLRITIVLLIILIVYLLFSIIIKGDIFVQTAYAYYTYLLTSLSNGQLNIVSPTNIDLSFFNGKQYLNWGPAPIVFIFPFYLLFGDKASDVFYTLVAGISNVVLFYLVIREFKKYFKLKLSYFTEAFIILSFAFTSPNFYLSLGGRIWHTEQIVATFYILIFLLYLLKFLNKNLVEIKYLLISAIFFNLAWFSRATMVFYGAFFLYIIFMVWRLKDIELLKKSLAIIAVPTFIFITMFLAYNNLRFNNPFETGLSYHDVNPRYEEFIAQKKVFSTDYIPHNVTQYFLDPALIISEKPYVKINLDGNSIFTVYPVFLLSVLLFRKKFLKDKIIAKFLGVSFVVVLMNLSLLMLYFATGWTQIGSRYILDIVPLVFLITLFAVKDLPKIFLILIFTYGAIINIFGSLIFNYY
jgi:hypothetical protein